MRVCADKIQISLIQDGSTIQVTTRTAVYSCHSQGGKYFVVPNNPSRDSGESELVGSMSPVNGEISAGFVERGKYLVYRLSSDSKSSAVKTSLILKVELDDKVKRQPPTC